MSTPNEGDTRVAQLEAELDRERHTRAALQRLAFALNELVPRAFEEGFKRRVPDTDEPWLIDWLQSESKRALEPMLRGSRGTLSEPSSEGALHAPKAE